MADTKPTVTIPEGAPPTDLVIEDIEVGDGTEAVAGANVTVHYVGVAWSDQQQFDASWDRDDLFEFPLGRGYVIAGWDQGGLAADCAWQSRRTEEIMVLGDPWVTK